MAVLSITYLPTSPLPFAEITKPTAFSISLSPSLRTHFSLFVFLFCTFLDISLKKPEKPKRNMEILSPGVLLNLLEQATSDEEKPALLQIRSIVPVLSETENDDLWPKQGFQLKVADSSHAMYVSLPQDQSDMVLRDELRLGQFILAEKLERDGLLSVPVLRGMRPVPGRHACLGDPEDLVATDASFASVDEPRERLFTPLNGTSPSSSSSAPTAKRRSWINGFEGSSSCPVLKLGTKPISRRKSACVTTSTIEFTKKGRSNGSSSSKTKNPKSVYIPDKSTACNSLKSTRNCEKSLEQAVTLSFANDRELGESIKKLLSPLPQNLAKLGKEVKKCRDLALLASIDALQEASAAGKLLKCLNTFSVLKSSNSKAKEKHPSSLSSLDMFFKLQEDLAQTRLLLHSLTNIKNLIRPNETDQNNHNSTKESAFKLAEDSKKGASSWINAALASDLVPLSPPSLRNEANNTAKRPSKTCGSKNKDTTTVLRKKSDTGDQKDNSQDWTKGSDLCACIGVANSLFDECKLWFLGYAERYLDGLLKSNKAFSMECSDSEVAQMMCQIKKVGDWLDDAAIFTEKDYELVEACGRLRNKIYGVLLKMAERTALALGTHNG